MDDDFNTAGALSHLFELVRMINQARAESARDEDLQSAQVVLRELSSVLGLQLAEKAPAISGAEPFIHLLLDLRSQLRAQKLWSLSDQIRNDLLNLGVVIEDSKEGTSWRWK